MKKRFVQYKSGTVLDTKTGDIYGPNKVIISNLGEEEAAAEYEIEIDPEDRKRTIQIPDNAISFRQHLEPFGSR